MWWVAKDVMLAVESRESGEVGSHRYKAGSRESGELGSRRCNAGSRERVVRWVTMQRCNAGSREREW